MLLNQVYNFIKGITTPYFLFRNIDHPVIYAKYLLLEAAKAVHYGLSEQDALASVTRVE